MDRFIVRLTFCLIIRKQTKIQPTLQPYFKMLSATISNTGCVNFFNTTVNDRPAACVKMLY